MEGGGGGGGWGSQKIILTGYGTTFSFSNGNVIDGEHHEHIFSHSHSANYIVIWCRIIVLITCRMAQVSGSTAQMRI